MRKSWQKICLQLCKVTWIVSLLSTFVWAVSTDVPTAADISAAARTAAKKDTPNDPVLEGILSSFAVPWEDLLKKQYESEWMNLFSGFSGDFSFDMPLRRVKPYNQTGSSNTGTQTNYSMTLRSSVRYNPLGYWFAYVNFYYYLNKAYKAPWNPDFVYSFGYDDWHPYTLSLVYSNYQNNRFNPDRARNEHYTEFNKGTYTLAWKFPIPDALAQPFLIDTEKKINCRLNYLFTPRYFDLVTTQIKQHKQVLSLGCNYPVIGDWYISTLFFYYPHRAQQQPWDPDYTYDLGFWNWKPGIIALQYHNYSGNRLPWRSSGANTGSFKDGSIGLSWSWAW